PYHTGAPSTPRQPPRLPSAQPGLEIATLLVHGGELIDLGIVEGADEVFHIAGASRPTDVDPMPLSHVARHPARVGIATRSLHRDEPAGLLQRPAQSDERFELVGPRPDHHPIRTVQLQAVVVPR